MQGVGIVLLCILTAIIYGVLHDQVTARLCVEYFTVGHPQFFGTDDPTLLAFGWGIVATWWVGLILGGLLAIVARAGVRPKRNVWDLYRPLIVLVLVTGCCALIAGVCGWLLAEMGMVQLVGEFARKVPPEKHAAFIADIWAHSASYIVGAVGGIVVMVQTWRSRHD